MSNIKDKKDILNEVNASMKKYAYMIKSYDSPQVYMSTVMNNLNIELNKYFEENENTSTEN